VLIPPSGPLPRCAHVESDAASFVGRRRRRLRRYILKNPRNEPTTFNSEGDRSCVI
jgi:hypothetical protein